MPRSIKLDWENVKAKQPKLIFDQSANKITGCLAVTDDDYQIEIDLDPLPHHFPLVRETGGRIPPIADRHIYPDSGCCCFTIKAREEVFISTKIDCLSRFVALIVVPYFENQSYYELTGKYAEGEYSHGISGLLEGYRDLLRFKNPIPVIWQYLRNIRLRSNHKCYCGSGLKLRKCHEKEYKNLSKISPDTLKMDFSLFYFNEIQRLELERRLFFQLKQIVRRLVKK